MMQQRQICDRAVFDGSADDPRVLVRRYQQRMRVELLAKVNIEAERRPWWSTCLSSLTTALRAIVTPAAASPTPASAPVRLVPVRLVPVRLARVA
jgi:hypothetical protein